MTNGEKFKEIFGISQVDEGVLYAFAWLPNHNAAEFCIDWWNAEYEEPITKNDLGVDGCIHKCIDKPTTFKDDNAVSRLSVRDIIYANAYELEYPDGSSEYVVNRDELIKYLMELPSITPQEPRKGHWIPTYGNVKCSVCGSVKDSREVGRATHYCDFCGAKMVEPQESEET